MLAQKEFLIGEKISIFGCFYYRYLIIYNLVYFRISLLILAIVFLLSSFFVFLLDEA